MIRRRRQEVLSGRREVRVGRERSGDADMTDMTGMMQAVKGCVYS